jgi:hypothetical protein
MTVTKCRFLYNNQLTGTLPVEWSALTRLGRTWVLQPAYLLPGRAIAINAQWVQFHVPRQFATALLSKSCVSRSLCRYC